MKNNHLHFEDQPAPASHRSEIRGMQIALAGYLVLLVLQLTAFFITHVTALLAMAYETLASIIIAGMLLVAIYISRKPADESHMFGYGRAQNVAAVISAVVFVAILSIETFRAAIPKFWQSTDASSFENINVALIVSIISMVLCTIPIIEIWRSKASGASIKAQLISSLEDVVAYGSGLIGTILVDRGYFLADPVASVFVGILIAVGGIFLFRDNVSYLIGKSPDRALLDKIAGAARSVEGVQNIHNLRAEYSGPGFIRAGIHIEVASGMSIDEADRLAHEVERRIYQESGCQYCVIQVHPPHTDEEEKEPY
jgi:cation diffusion facilitator family transporter